MAATAWRVYNEAKKYLLTADLDINAGAIRMKIVKATSAAAVSSYTISTFASVAGITTNLKTPTSKTPGAIVVTSVGSAKQIMFDSTAVVFSASGGSITSIRYAMIGVSGGKALCWCRLSDTHFSLSSGNTLTITPNANGYFTLTGGTT